MPQGPLAKKKRKMKSRRTRKMTKRKIKKMKSQARRLKTVESLQYRREAKKMTRVTTTS
jgi:hypothetical protein